MQHPRPLLERHPCRRALSLARCFPPLEPGVRSFATAFHSEMASPFGCVGRRRAMDSGPCRPTRGRSVATTPGGVGADAAPEPGSSEASGGDAARQARGGKAGQGVCRGRGGVTATARDTLGAEAACGRALGPERANTRGPQTRTVIISLSLSLSPTRPAACLNVRATMRAAPQQLRPGADRTRRRSSRPLNDARCAVAARMHGPASATQHLASALDTHQGAQALGTCWGPALRGPSRSRRGGSNK